MTVRVKTDSGPTIRRSYPSSTQNTLYYSIALVNIAYALIDNSNKMASMSIDQPEASTSTSSPRHKHHVSLVVDSALAREQYLRLVEANGVVHSLVQRLLEKHGGDQHVSDPGESD